MLSESYRNRLKILAGLLNEKIEMTQQDVSAGWAKSSERTAYNESRMLDAIESGRVIGISYKSKNDKYEMPVTKFRFVMPVTLGKINGKLMLSGYHLHGQSEKEARISGVRSAEAKGVWRLFEITPDKFKGMWDTDLYFYENPPGYKKNDSRMDSIIAQYDVNKAIEIKNQRDAAKQSEEPRTQSQEPEISPEKTSDTEYPINEKSYPERNRHRRGRRRIRRKR
jgi:hypothetical protein